MTIDEYKKKLISVVEEMEKEHGFDVESVLIQVHSFSSDRSIKNFNVIIMS